jgi:hypothetical protein
MITVATAKYARDEQDLRVEYSIFIETASSLEDQHNEYGS